MTKEFSPPPSIETNFTMQWRKWLNEVYEKLRGPLWEDYTETLANAQPRGTAPTLSAFGATSITQQYEFKRGDGIQVAFHVKHDIKPGSKIYPHVHWSTDGTAATSGVSDVVEWVIEYEIAKGHQQEAFVAGTPITLTQSVYNDVSTGPTNPDPWHHYICEASDTQAIDAPEIDSLILVKVSRGTTSDTYSTGANGHVFGLYVDLHYQRDRFGTPQKNPRDSNGNLVGFYTRTK